MENNQDFRDLLNEKFTGIHQQIEDKFNVVNVKLESIEKQVIRTNGRVNLLETSTKNLEINQTKHDYNCPQNSRFAAIEQAVLDFKNEKSKDIEVAFIRKYPKLSLSILAFSVFLMISSWGSYIKTSENQVIMKEVKFLEDVSIKLQKDIQTLNMKIEEFKKVK